MIQPDNPQLISVKLLERLDADEPPGTWLAQPKYDGYRCLVHVDGDSITFQSKHGKRLAIPVDVACHWHNLLRQHDGISLDCEWMGPRRGLDGCFPTHRLWAFDLLREEGKWLRTMQFKDRLSLLVALVEDSKGMLPMLPIRANPGLPIFFVEQLSDPFSEGIVVRRSTSGLILNDGSCRDNPQWFKVKHSQMAAEKGV